MKYYWIASTIEIKAASHKNTLCACKMRGEGNMQLNNLNVGNRYCRLGKKACFRHLSAYSTMPKSKPSTSCHLKAIVSEFGDDIFSTDGKILFCKVCETKVAVERKFTVQQHVGREKHIREMQLASKKKSTQLLLQETSCIKDNKSSDFRKTFEKP
jgi:hypothetical protein